MMTLQNRYFCQHYRTIILLEVLMGCLWLLFYWYFQYLLLTHATLLSTQLKCLHEQKKPNQATQISPSLTLYLERRYIVAY